MAPSSGTPEPLAAILAEMRGIAGNMETAAKKFDVEHRQDKRCLKHPHCFRAADLLRDANGLRDWADRIEAAVKWEHRQLRSLVGRFANCHEDNEDFGALLREARFVLADTPYAVADGEPVAVPHGRVAEKAGAESRPFVGVDLAKGRPTYTCVEIASGNAAAMREALEECRDYLYGVLRDAFHDAQVSEQSGTPSMAGYEREQKLHKAVEAALAAPARNCDRFATEREAFAFYLDHTPDNGNIIDGFPPWLFATEAVYGDAAPAEGGAK